MKFNSIPVDDTARVGRENWVSTDLGTRTFGISEVISKSQIKCFEEKKNLLNKGIENNFAKFFKFVVNTFENVSNLISW